MPRLYQVGDTVQIHASKCWAKDEAAQYFEGDYRDAIVFATITLVVASKYVVRAEHPELGECVVTVGAKGFVKASAAAASEQLAEEEDALDEDDEDLPDESKEVAGELIAHGQVWKPAEVVSDPGLEHDRKFRCGAVSEPQWKSTPAYNKATAPEQHKRTPFDALHTVVSDNFVGLIMNNLRAVPDFSRFDIEPCEVFVFFAILAYFALSDLDDMHCMWQQTRADDPFNLFSFPQMGRFMSRDRFLFIWLNFAGQWNGQDLMRSMRELALAFNMGNVGLVRIGSHICFDESMSSYRGYEAEKRDVAKGAVPEGAAPTLMHINGNKPVSDGVWSYSACVNVRNRQPVMLWMEPLKAPLVELSPEQRKLGERCQAVLRFVHFYKIINGEAWRTLFFDSGYGSVELVECLLVLHLYAVTQVKIISRRTPLKAIKQSMEGSSRGAWKSWITQVQGGELRATCWRLKHNMLTLYSRGTDREGEPLKRRRFKDGAWYDKVDKRPEVCQQYAGMMGLVDRHNRLRQGEIDLERNLRTNFIGRRYGCTLIGVYFTNAAAFYKDDHRFDDMVDVPTHQFLRLLINEVFNFAYVRNNAVPRALRSPAAPRSPAAASPIADGHVHVPGKLRDYNYYRTGDGSKRRKKPPQRRCRLCSADVTTTCSTCCPLDSPGDAIFGVHTDPSSNCWKRHMQHR